MGMQEIIQDLQAKVDSLLRFQKNQSNTFFLEGVLTNGADTRTMWSHPLKKVPSGYYPVYGDIYVFERTSEQVDIRTSKEENIKFGIILF